MHECTVAVIKPDVVKAKRVGEIITLIEHEGFTIREASMGTWYPDLAWDFYDEHRDKPFFDGLIKFMASGPSLLLILQAPDAVARWRKMAGSTDPAQAAVGTIRQLFGTGMPNNAVHASATITDALREMEVMGVEVEDD